MLQNEIIPGLIGSSEVASRFLVSRAEPVTGEWQSSRDLLSERPKALRDFWSAREALLRREWLENRTVGAAQALAKLYLREGRWTEAERHLADCADLRARSPALQAAFLQYLCARDRSHAREYLVELREQGSNFAAEPELLSELARTALAEGDRRAARSWADRINLAGLEMQNVAMSLAEIYWQLGEEGPARAAADHALLLDPDLAPALNIKACVQVRNGDFAGAKSLFQEALEKDGLCRPALLNFAVFCRNYLGIESPLDRLGSYLDAYPSDLQFWLRYGFFANDCGHRDVLPRVLAALRAAAPDSEQYWRIALLTADTSLKDAEQAGDRNAVAGAREAWRETLGKVPVQCAESMVDAAIWWAARPGTSLERPLSERNWESCPSSDWARHFVMGVEQWVGGEQSSGCERMRVALSMVPDNAQVRRHLMRVLTQMSTGYREAAEVGDLLLRSPFSSLADWNNVIYANLMCGNVTMAEERWVEVDRRPAWRQERRASPFVAATEGLLCLKRGLLREGETQYGLAARLAKSPAVRTLVAQKADLEVGRALWAAGERELGRARLAEAAHGPNEQFAVEARSVSTGSDSST